MDYIFRWLDLRFGDASQAKKAAEAEAPPMLVDDAPKSVVAEKTAAPAARGDDLEHTVFKAQADAPPCHACGAIMVRSGACYKCFNCGATSGCS
jgi:ribonucleoside-diphosphate reductase alpha chain